MWCRDRLADHGAGAEIYQKEGSGFGVQGSGSEPDRGAGDRQAQAGTIPIYVLAHGYGPIDDFRKRIEVAHKAGKHGMWVNRYAYLTDEKLEAIGQVTNG